MSLRGERVIQLTRCSWSPKEAVARDEDMAPELVFSRTAGPLLITLESGLVIGVASQPALISVTLWREQPPYTSADPELHPIEANDPVFSDAGFGQMLGKRITAVAVVTRDPENAKWEDRPREVAVVLTFDGAPELFLSHGLHDNSDDFSVLMRKDVKASLWPRLHERPIG